MERRSFPYPLKAGRRVLLLGVRRLAVFVSRHPWAVLLVWALLAVLSLPFAARAPAALGVRRAICVANVTNRLALLSLSVPTHRHENANDANRSSRPS